MLHLGQLVLGLLGNQRAGYKCLLHANAIRNRLAIGPDSGLGFFGSYRAGLTWLGLAWLCWAWLGLTWLGLACRRLA